MTTQVSKAQENPSLGVMLMIGFCICAPLLDVCAKLASETIPVGQVTTARFFFQAIIMLPIMWAMGFSFGFPITLLVVFLGLYASTTPLGYAMEELVEFSLSFVDQFFESIYNGQ